MASGSTVISALFYLRARSLQNVLLSRFRRLKQPKYMVGGVIGIAYFYFAFFRQFQRPQGRLPGGPLEGMSTAGLSWTVILGAAALLVFVALCWVLRRQRAALSFTEAEISFLFPAPFSRRALVHYRLISLGLTSTFTALILALVSRRMPGISAHALMRILGWWLIFATLSLHTVGSSFVITRWMDRGISPFNCQLIALAVVAVVVGGPAFWLWQTTPVGAFPTIATLQTGPVAWLLLPFKWALAPLLATDWRAFALAIGPALLIYAAHYLWVLRVHVGFEEASVAKAEKTATKLAAIRAGNWRAASGRQKARPAPFDIGRTWRPELAFLWKNLLSTAEYLRPRTWLIAAALLVIARILLADSDLFRGMRSGLTIGAGVLAAYTIILGPQLARQDFRSDMLNTDILKTYPLRGWQIMLGEILTPAAILTGVIWLMLLTVALVFTTSDAPHMAWLTPQIRTAAVLGLALVAPLLCMSQLLIVNSAAVLFPAWLQTSTNRTQQGIDVMGQRILFMFGQMLALVVMLLPALIMGGLAFVGARWLAGDAVGVGAAALFIAVVMAAEIGLGIGWLGSRFERLDLSQELRP